MDIVEALRDKGFRVACEPEAISPTLRRRVLQGPCLFSGTLGPLRIKGVLVLVDYTTSEVVKELAMVRLKKGVPLALVVSRDPPPRELVELASIMGVGVVQAEFKPPSESGPVEYVILPEINEEAARKIFETKVRSSLTGIFGGVLSSKKVVFAGSRLAYIVIACYDVLLHIREHGEVLEAQRSSLCFETATGSLVGVEKGRLRVREEFSRLGELNEEAIRILEIIAGGGRVTMAEIVEHFGDPERARMLVDFLVELGLVEPDYEGFFHVVEPRIEDYVSLKEYYAGKGKLVEGRPAKCARVIEPVFDLSILDRIVKAFGLVETESLVYYPIYVGVFRKYKNHKKYVDTAVIIDGVTGERLEDLEEILVDSNAIYQLDQIIEEVARNAKAECPEGSEPARPAHSPPREAPQGAG